MLRLAFRNLFRHRGRTALTLTVVVFGVVGLVLSGGFVRDLLYQLREWSIHSRLGHLQVYREGYYQLGRREPFEYVIAEPGPVTVALASLPHVTDVMQRVNFFGLLNNGRADVPVIGEGIEADKEARLGTSVVIDEGRPLAPTDEYGIAIGRGVAHALGVGPGDYVTLVVNTAAGAMNTLELEVVGVFSTVSKEYDARATRILLPTARLLLDTGAVHSLVVSLDNTDRTEPVRALAVQALGPHGLEVRTWEELDDFYRKAVELYRRQFGVFQAIILLMVLLSVANSVSMSAYERVGEFGTLRALGRRSHDVFRLVMVENAMLGLLGAVLGAAAGVGLAALISRVGIPMPPPPNSSLGYTATIRLEVATVVTASLIGLAATVLAALLAARRAARVPVVDALRQNI